MDFARWNRGETRSWRFHRVLCLKRPIAVRPVPLILGLGMFQQGAPPALVPSRAAAPKKQRMTVAWGICSRGRSLLGCKCLPCLSDEVEAGCRECLLERLILRPHFDRPAPTLTASWYGSPVIRDAEVEMIGGSVALMQVPNCKNLYITCKGRFGKCALLAKTCSIFRSGVAQLMSLETFWG